MSEELLRTVAAGELTAARVLPVDPETLTGATRIVEDVRARGAEALLEHARRLGDVEEGEPLVWPRERLERALAELPEDQQALLRRTAQRIEAFAHAQLETLRETTVPVLGGSAGQSIRPVARAGCYAPGGRYPLPSSVLMTAVTARAAGVPSVWVASPRPAPVTLAAAAVAGADALLAAGGAQAIAALAYGAGEVPACDVVCGPGNRWVTAAKKLVSGTVAIDMLAGPSELVVLADASADPRLVAADLLAQAEHDPDARPILVTTHAELIAATRAELEVQTRDLPTREVALAALRVHGRAVHVGDLAAAVELVDHLAPEHLEVLTYDPEALAGRLEHHGALFLGPQSAEVFGDYGVGPNHVLPTGGTARSRGGLSVFTFLRLRTWLRMEAAPSSELVDDAAALARLEGLEAHARAAEARRGTPIDRA